MLMVFASQHVFYFGIWPIGAVPRYLFPGILAQHIAVFLFFVVTAKIISIKFPWLRSWVWVVYLIGALSFLKFSVKDLSANRVVSKEVATNTASFTTRLNEALGFLRAHPSAPLILSSNSVLDYEPVYSIQRFVTASGLTNPIALKLNGYSSKNYSKDSERLALMLTGALEKIQYAGESGFVPLRSVDAVAECFSMGMSGPPLARCKSGNIIWP